MNVEISPTLLTLLPTPLSVKPLLRKPFVERERKLLKKHMKECTKGKTC
jgi:hypothetical protein